jgi:opacity protein-like surface antigen
MFSLKNLLVGAGLAVLVAGQASAATAIPACGALPNDHQIAFSLAPGASCFVPLPAVQVPIRVMVSETLKNGGTQTPSELMTAVVDTDPSSLQLTWIGTSSNGVQSAGTTLGNPLIANIGGNFDLTAKTPVAGVTPNGSLIISYLLNRGSVTANFVITLIW